MATVFDRLIPKKASSLISKYGASVTVTKKTQGVFDPATGVAAETTSTFAAKAVVEPAKAGYGGRADIVTGDMKCIFAASGLGFVPEVNDVVMAGGVEYDIAGVYAVFSGDAVALYETILRK
jgi:hypothetical protein